MPKDIQCKRCANLCNEWCKVVVDSPDPELVRDCAYYWGQTKGEMIRRMDNCELAEFLGDVKRHRFDYPESEEAWLEWLEQEVINE